MKRNQLFDRFLVETGLIRPFLKNIRKSHHPSFSADGSGLGHLMNFDPMDYISLAFSWRDSPEGFAYWYLVHATWTGLVKGNFSFNDAKARIKAIQYLVADFPR